jgi:hypothetical protein
MSGNPNWTHASSAEMDQDHLPEPHHTATGKWECHKCQQPVRPKTPQELGMTETNPEMTPETNPETNPDETEQSGTEPGPEQAQTTPEPSLLELARKSTEPIIYVQFDGLKCSVVIGNIDPIQIWGATGLLNETAIQMHAAAQMARAQESQLLREVMTSETRRKRRH